MPRLVDADKILAALSVFRDREHGNHHFMNGIATAKEIIESQPTVDAVPVVRCKDCKYWNPKHAYCEGVGNWFGMVDEWSENGFCYKGERKNDVTLN